MFEHQLWGERAAHLAAPKHHRPVPLHERVKSPRASTGLQTAAHVPPLPHSASLSQSRAQGKPHLGDELVERRHRRFARLILRSEPGPPSKLLVSFKPAEGIPPHPANGLPHAKSSPKCRRKTQKDQCRSLKGSHIDHTVADSTFKRAESWVRTGRKSLQRRAQRSRLHSKPGSLVLPAPLQGRDTKTTSTGPAKTSALQRPSLLARLLRNTCQQDFTDQALLRTYLR